MSNSMRKPFADPCRLTLLSVLVCCCVLPVHAQLSWEDREVLLEPSQTEAGELIATYRFNNTGNYPVTIRKVMHDRRQPHRYRLRVERLDQRTFRPGESGEVRVRFDPRRSQGERHCVLTVVTDESDTPETELFLHVSVPVLLEMDRSVLRWTVGSEATTQAIDVRAPSEQAVRVTGADCDGAFDVEIEEVEPGRHYRLLVTPRDVSEVGLGRIVLQTDLPDARMPALICTTVVTPARPEPEEPAAGEPVPAAPSSSDSDLPLPPRSGS